MDEYGSLLGLIGYLERNADKAQLILRIENKILCPTIKDITVDFLGE